MDRSEFKIGEVFQCGVVTLECIKRKSNYSHCEGCFFSDYGQCMDHKHVTGHCASVYREDKTDVIFIKVEE